MRKEKGLLPISYPITNPPPCEMREDNEFIYFRSSHKVLKLSNVTHCRFPRQSERERERERVREREREREKVEKKTDRQTDRQADRQNRLVRVLFPCTLSEEKISTHVVNNFL